MLAPLRPCLSSPPCPTPHRGKCPARVRAADRARASEARTWYTLERWRRLRRVVLLSDPVCHTCHVAPSTEVDHVQPHRGDAGLFWDTANLQGLCATCHSQKTRRGE